MTGADLRLQVFLNDDLDVSGISELCGNDCFKLTSGCKSSLTMILVCPGLVNSVVMTDSSCPPPPPLVFHNNGLGVFVTDELCGNDWFKLPPSCKS